MIIKTENTIKKSIEYTEKRIEAVAEKLDVKLPKIPLPLPIKIITLIIVAGSFSILGGIFTDFIIPNSGSNANHLYRLVIGLIFLLIAYGIYDRRRWALWLYGTIIFIGIFINFILAFIPTLIVIYLYTERKVLRPGYIDKLFDKFFKEIKSKYYIIFYKKSSTEK